MAKVSIEDQIKAAQNRVAELKKKQAKERKQNIEKIGQAVVDRCPQLLDMMREDGFNIFEFVKSEGFANLFVTDEAKAEQQEAVSAPQTEVSEQQEAASVPQQVYAGTNNSPYNGY